MISVIVCTRNRPEKLRQCLRSILNSSFKKFEIIIVDQSDKSTTFFNKIKKVKYFKLESVGLSRARNYGIEKSSGEILAFTDDDCLVSRYWLKIIQTAFKQYPEIAGVFGRVSGYFPNENKGLICPCELNLGKTHLISEKNLKKYSWKVPISGNNMAIPKKIFKEIGNFKSWLGAGSLSHGGEDVEFTLRLLLKKDKLLYQSKMLVFHNRWLDKKTMDLQNSQYLCGEAACYFYLALKGHRQGWKIILDDFINLARKLKDKTTIQNIYNLRIFSLDIYMYILGLGLAFFNFFREKTR